MLTSLGTEFEGAPDSGSLQVPSTIFRSPKSGWDIVLKVEAQTCHVTYGTWINNIGESRQESNVARLGEGETVPTLEAWVVPSEATCLWWRTISSSFQFCGSSLSKISPCSLKLFIFFWLKWCCFLLIKSQHVFWVCSSMKMSTIKLVMINPTATSAASYTCASTAISSTAMTSTTTVACIYIRVCHIVTSKSLSIMGYIILNGNDFASTLFSLKKCKHYSDRT